MADYKGMAYLKRKLAAKKSRVDLRYRYYEMKFITRDLGISTPPDLRNWISVLGWCGRAVDCLADRLSFRSFENDVFDMNGIYEANNQDIFIDSALLGALISACDFIYITANESGFPLMRVIDGRHATGIIDPTTNMLKEGYAVIETDEWDRPVTEAYFIPGETWIYEKGAREPYMVANAAPYPLLVPIIYRPDAVRPFGHSRISRACMNIVQSAVRTVKRSEISAEFYSYPQKYVLGLSQDAERMEKWKASMSSMLQFDKDEDGDHPSVGQFQAAAQTPHTEQLRMFAGLFAGETGLTLDDLGFPSQNPSSSEAIKASHETLRLTARRAQKTFGVGLLNAGYLAACVRDDYPYLRNQVVRTELKWDPIFEPDISSLSGVGDAVQKIQTAFPGYFDEAKLKDLTGI
ncbi:MAG: hypothetical protein Q4D81_00450 [Eubacteriales bacterium]|nr:hypothetical protein [Eubacteriales bacterium]